MKYSIPTNSDFYQCDLGDDSNMLIVFPERIILFFPKNVNRSPFYSVLISQLSGFAGRELCKTLKVSLKVFCFLSLNDAALIREMFYVHTSWDQLPPMSCMSMTSTIYLIVVFMRLLAFLSTFYKKPLSLSSVG